jgi:hypothetical protein
VAVAAIGQTRVSSGRGVGLMAAEPQGTMRAIGMLSASCHRGYRSAIPQADKRLRAIAAAEAWDWPKKPGRTTSESGEDFLSYRHRDAVETPPQPCGQKPFTYWMRCGPVRLA